MTAGRVDSTPLRTQSSLRGHRLGTLKQVRVSVQCGGKGESCYSLCPWCRRGQTDRLQDGVRPRGTETEGPGSQAIHHLCLLDLWCSPPIRAKRPFTSRIAGTIGRRLRSSSRPQDSGGRPRCGAIRRPRSKLGSQIQERPLQEYSRGVQEAEWMRRRLAKVEWDRDGSGFTMPMWSQLPHILLDARPDRPPSTKAFVINHSSGMKTYPLPC